MMCVRAPVLPAAFRSPVDLFDLLSVAPEPDGSMLEGTSQTCLNFLPPQYDLLIRQTVGCFPPDAHHGPARMCVLYQTGDTARA